MFTVFPPAWTPSVSRLTTDGALLTAALVAGRDAVNVLFAAASPPSAGRRARRAAQTSAASAEGWPSPHREPTRLK